MTIQLTNNVLTTTITITPAPHSFELSEGTNFPGYFNAGSMGNPDVTVPTKEVRILTLKTQLSTDTCCLRH